MQQVKRKPEKHQSQARSAKGKHTGNGKPYRNRTATENEQLRIQRALADKLTDALGETDPNPRHQLHRIVRTLGGPVVVEILRETIRIQQQGGMLTLDGSRKRTNGGVFMRLAKGRMTHEQRARIFPRMKKAKKQSPKTPAEHPIEQEKAGEAA